MLNSIAEKTFAVFDNPNIKKIISELENAVAKVIKFSPLAAEKIELNDNSIERLKSLAEFDWIIFPDVLTVDFFLQILVENTIDFSELDEIRVCAFGEVVSDRLRFAQLHADVIPNTNGTEDVLSALKNYVAAEDFKNLKFLLPKEISFQNELKNELLKTGGKVAELPIYQIKTVPENETSKLKALVKGGAIDEFIFSAPTDFIWLYYIFNGEPLARIFNGIEISAIDGNVYQTVRENNFKRASLFNFDKIAKVER